MNVPRAFSSVLPPVCHRAIYLLLYQHSLKPLTCPHLHMPIMCSVLTTEEGITYRQETDKVRWSS